MTAYSMGDYRFDLDRFFPVELFDRITDLRASGAARKIVAKEAARRKKRKTPAPKGRLTIVAADHPARNVVKSGDDPVAMADRRQYLGRVLRVLANPGFDGVMGTTDILEDLFLVHSMMKETGGRDFLDEKVMLGCMNRGGLSGASFEMDDTFTSFTAESLERIGADGAKLMVRLDMNSADSAKTLLDCANAITELNRRKIPAFLEILPGTLESNKFKLARDAESLAKMAGIGTALGDSSTGIWLKLPYCENYRLVAAASTCPILMLGGESTGDPTGILKDFIEGMACGGSVRGALVGRNVTFPGLDDPYAVAEAVRAVVHENASFENAVERLLNARDENLDALAGGAGGEKKK